LSLGAKIYEDHCVQCHQSQGQGVPGAYPALANNRAVLLSDPTNLVQSVLYGGYPVSTTLNPRPFGMPPYILTLEDREIAAVLTHLRTQWGNQAPEVTPLQVNRIRSLQGP
jgi:mono/diheme cytochrome c family protein